MARRGLDVVLISRTKAKLDTVAADIGESFALAVRVLKSIHPRVAPRGRAFARMQPDAKSLRETRQEPAASATRPRRCATTLTTPFSRPSRVSSTAAQYKVRTKVIEADFTSGDEVYDAIDKELMGLDISVLVNNVGMSYPHPEYFLGLPDRSKVRATN